MLAKHHREQDNLSKEDAQRKVSQLVESMLPQQKTREDLLRQCDNDARIDRYVRFFSYCYISPNYHLSLLLYVRDV